MAALLFFLVLLELLTVGYSTRDGCGGNKMGNQRSGMEFSLFHRDSRLSPMNMRSGMRHSQRMSQYLSEDIIRVSEMAGRIKKHFLAQSKRKITQNKVSISIDGISKVFTLGAYVLTTNIGTPPKRQYLLLSTSSEFSWVQCAGCTKCYKQLSDPYKPSNSSSSSFKSCASNSDCNFAEAATNCTATKCTYTNGYSSNQIVSGNIVSDIFKFNQYGQSTIVSSPKLHFGCTTYATGYGSYADGVAGFGPGPFSIPNQMASFLGRNAFSSCLVPYFVDNTSKLVVGPASIPKQGVSYTPLINTSSVTDLSHYYIRLTGVNVGNKSLSIPSSAWSISSVDGSGGTILDAGTTFTFFVPSAFNAIIAEVKTQMLKKLKVAKRSGYSLCFSVKPPNILALNNYFPNVTLLLSGGGKITLQGYHYVDKTTPTISCVTFQKSSAQNVLGTLIFQNMLVVHDITGQRVGFQAMDCVTNKRL